MSAGKTLKIFKEFLTPYEQGEILDYKSIYYIGIGATKVKNFMKDVDNYGFDDDKGDYKLMVADHIAYRYEIVDALGKGSFG